MTSLVAWNGLEPVGHLTLKSNGNLQFRYDASYGGPAISQALPIQSAAHPHATTRAVFGGLLPEGDARVALANNLGLSPSNDFALLAAVGGDVAGAISLLPEGTAPSRVPTSEPLDDSELDRVLRDLPQRPLAADGDEGIRLSLAGAQAKVPVIVDRDGRMALPTSSAAATTHILKPEPSRFPGLVDNEAFCMQLAGACGLSSARVSKAETISGLRFLTVERYDRDLEATPIRRIHQEDFCQALGQPSDRKYQQEGGPSVRDLSTMIRTCTTAPARELPRLMQALAFNWIIGNCDAHGKNFSLLYRDGETTVAPLYDLVSTVVYPELTTRLAMTLGDARHLAEVTPRSWAALATAVQLRPAFVATSVQAVLERAATRASALAQRPEHANSTAARINERIQRLAVGFLP